jgi:hypothetical protein
MSPLNYEKMIVRLRDAFAEAEVLVREDHCPILPESVETWLDSIFDSGTQAYREVLIGCVIVSLDDTSLDIRKPYANQAPDAFNGRTLDEKVVNPFLHEKRIPSSRGPYLSTFRRSVDFTPATRQGVRDKAGFDALLHLIDYVRSAAEDGRSNFLIKLLCRFVQLRESSNIPLSKLNRVSLAQYSQLIAGLLKVPSGGRIPVIVVVAVLHAIKSHFSLGWTIEYQGINEADAAAGAGGDVTVRDGEAIILAAEITEREVSKSRVVAIFNRKISPAAIRDYIFFAPYSEEALAQANQYFAQGSEVNFVDIHNWMSMSLVTMGQTGRDAFNAQMTLMLAAEDVPRSVKVAWNELVASITII